MAESVDKQKWSGLLKTIRASASREVREAYLKAIEEITEILATSPKGVAANFAFSDLPKATQKKVDSILHKLAESVELSLMNGVRAADSLMEERMTDVQKTIYTRGNGAEVLTAKEAADWLQVESTKAATEAFTQRKINGETLSDRVWKRTELLKDNIETALYGGIEKGLSAAELSQEIRDALNQPQRLFRRVRQPDGTLALSKAAKAYHPGQGVYRSSYKNAVRLTGNEINKAYRHAFQERIKPKEWITGKRIKLSNNHTSKDGKGGLIPGWTDECDVLQGLYPKDFVWYGWHVSCFKSDTEVLTNRGWLLFKDVDIDNDLVWSLNPDTRDMEWSKVTAYMERDYSDPIYRFQNKGVDFAVTHDHPMLLVNSEGAIYRKSAKDLFETPQLWQHLFTEGDCPKLMGSMEFYSGVVYDLELEKNHTMYLRRNGKCFWGSNCRCEQVIVHIDPEQAILDFKNGTNSAVQITEPHAGYQKWIADQRAKAEELGSGAFDKRMKRDAFLSENGKYQK